MISNALRFSDRWGKLIGIPRSPSPVSHVCSTDLFSQHNMQATVSPQRPSIGAYMQSSASPALSLPPLAAGNPLKMSVGEKDSVILGEERGRNLEGFQVV